MYGGSAPIYWIAMGPVLTGATTFTPSNSETALTTDHISHRITAAGQSGFYNSILPMAFNAGTTTVTLKYYRNVNADAEFARRTVTIIPIMKVP